MLAPIDEIAVGVLAGSHLCKDFLDESFAGSDALNEINDN